MSPQYRKGVERERKLVNEARARGLISFRSAASKSPIDVITIDIDKKEIELIQSKVGMSEVSKRHLEEKFIKLNGVYIVRFKCL